MFALIIMLLFDQNSTNGYRELKHQGFKCCQSFNSVLALYNTGNKAIVTNEEKKRTINCNNIQYVAKSRHLYTFSC